MNLESSLRTPSKSFTKSNSHQQRQKNIRRANKLVFESQIQPEEIEINILFETTRPENVSINIINQISRHSSLNDPQYGKH